MVLFAAQTSVSFMAIKSKRALQNKKEIFADKQILYVFLSRVFRIDCHQYIHTYIHKLYLSPDFSVAYIASISDPN